MDQQKTVFKNQIKLINKSVTLQNQEININTDSLVLIGCGLDHMVLKSLDSQNHVLIFKRAGKHAEKFTTKSLELQNIYFKFLNRKFTDLVPFIWPVQPMYISAVNDHELESILIQLEYNINGINNIKQIRNSEPGRLKLNRSFKSAYLSKNIFDKQKFNTIIQFKPKSILPDIYSEKILDELSQQFELETTFLKRIIQQRSPIQKTRWFKKINSNSQQNQNPFKIFDMTKQISIDFIESKGHKLLPQLSKDEKILLNESIHGYLISHPTLLWNIYTLQLMVTGSPDDINTDNLQLLQYSQANLNKQLDQLVYSLTQNKQSLDTKQYIEWLRKYNCLDKLTSKKLSRECEIISFLIGLAWRDISLVYRANFNGNSFENPEIWILDYYLKDLDKIQYNKEKDRKLLRKYILSKLKQ